MSNIDAAYQRTTELLQEWRSGASILGTALSEADTRAKVIDPIFRDVLGWPERNLVREEPSGAGFVDYVLRDADRAFALIEAKRLEPRFRLATTRAREGYLIGGPALSDKLVRGAILQAAQYSAVTGCPYAVVTNGFQFIAFRSITEIALTARKALVYADLDDREQFRDFFELLSFEAVLQGSLYQRFLQFQAAPSRVVARDRLQAPDRELTRNKLWGVLSHLATRVLEDRAEWRLDVIEHCYVPTRESKEADSDLKALIEHSPASLIRDMGGQPVGASIHAGIGRVLEDSIKNRRSGVYVLTGGAGSGKTTFLNHFQYVVAAALVENWCAWFHVDFLPAGTPGQEQSDVEDFIYRVVRRQIKENYNDEIKTDGMALREIFKIELQQLEETLLFDVAHGSEERTKLINAEVYQLNRSDKDFCRAAIRRLVSLGRRPVFVLDNSDQLGEEFQERVFLIAKAIEGEFSAICMVALREEKFYAAYYRGVFNAYPTQKFYIGSPDLQEVLRKRLEYGVRLLRDNINEFLPQVDGTNALSPQDCFELLDVFIKSVTKQNRNIVRMLESVAAGNIRFGLEMFRDFVGSGNTKVGEILNTYRQSGGYTVAFHQFAKSVMLGNRAFYRSGSSAIINVYAVSTAPHVSHFTTLRVLRYLFDRQSSASAHGTGFVDASELEREYLNATELGADLEETLVHLVRTGLVESEPPRAALAREIMACKIGASGAYYLKYLAQSFAYLDLIAFDTAITDSQLVNHLVSSAHIENMAVRIERVESFLDYLVRDETAELASMAPSSPFSAPIMPAVVEQIGREIGVIKERALARDSHA